MLEETIRLDEALEKCLPQIITNSKARQAIIDLILENEDDLFQDAEIVYSVDGKGSFDVFQISVHEWYGIYWITATEFDTIGYFTDLDEAISCAESNYDEFIACARNEAEDEDDQTD